MSLTIDNNKYNEVPEYVRYKTAKLNERAKSFDCREPETVLQTLFTLSTQHLYASLLKTVPNLNSKTVVVTGSVRMDGVGDYYHIIHTAEQIKKAYPDLKIEVIPVIDANPFPSLKLLDPSRFETLLCPSNAIPSQAIEKIKQAALIFEVSQLVNRGNEYGEVLQAKMLEGKHGFIGEYATAYWGLAMGVSDTELGIAIKEKPPSTSLLDLENTPLKQILFQTDKPTQECLENYFKNHELFTGYLKSGSFYQMGLIYTIACLQENSSKGCIDICLPDVDMTILDTEFLKNHGIGKISIIKNSKNSFVENQITLGEGGKELRFINPFPLNQCDFYTLMLQGNPLVGCTGDHSLSEALSFNLLPFYEKRPMKRNFWDDMIVLAGEVGGPSHLLQQYFKILSKMFYDTYQEHLITYYQYIQAGSIIPRDYVADKLDFFKNEQPVLTNAAECMAKLLQSSEIYEEMSQLSELLKQQYNFNEIIKDITARKLVLQAYPGLQKYEKELCDQFMAEKIDAVAVNALLKDKIASFMEENSK